MEAKLLSVIEEVHPLLPGPSLGSCLVHQLHKPVDMALNELMGIPCEIMALDKAGENLLVQTSAIEKSALNLSLQIELLPHCKPCPTSPSKSLVHIVMSTVYLIGQTGLTIRIIHIHSNIKCTVLVIQKNPSIVQKVHVLPNRLSREGQIELSIGIPGGPVCCLHPTCPSYPAIPCGTNRTVHWNLTCTSVP